MESFGALGIFIPHVFHHILQLWVEVTTSEIGSANSTLEFFPLLLQLTEEEQRADKLGQPKQGETLHP